MKFDAIIIGSGMGGATTGYALAKSGMRVLFLEKGMSRLLNNKMIQGEFAETAFQRQHSKQAVLKYAGRVSGSIQDKSRLVANAFTPFIGECGGGSSALYGAILERFKKEDFSKGTGLNGQSKDASIWPVSYDEMEPYYQAAEKLYEVSPAVGGKPDKLSQANQKIWHQLEENGLHPYILPTATDKRPDCIDNCQSFLCRHQCKNDSEKSCLKPVIEQFGAQLWDHCEVLRLEENAGRIKKIICRRNDQIISVASDIVILSAGALASPYLLFQSSNSDWTNGLANSSGILGRYLMRHYIDLFAVDMADIPVNHESQKQIGFNDYYQLQGTQFGTVQSFGQMPPVEVVMEELAESLPLGGGGLSRLLKLIQPIINWGYHKQFANKLVFASIMEDSACDKNRVWSDNQMLSIRYNIPPEDRKKIRQFRRLVMKAFAPFKIDVIKQANNNKRIAHACGTCRFGEDPTRSVLNRFNQTHDIANLYITDASFFPTSGGINPSLTIAANALRVGEYIIKNA